MLSTMTFCLPTYLLQPIRSHIRAAGQTSIVLPYKALQVTQVGFRAKTASGSRFYFFIFIFLENTNTIPSTSTRTQI